MTVSELYRSVAQLGFEDSLEDDNRFIYAANRALLQVNSIRPVTKAHIINHKPLDNMIKSAGFEPIEKKDDLFYYVDNAKAYYFEADGKGTLCIEKLSADGDWKDAIDPIEFATSGFQAISGFIKEGDEFVTGQLRLHFTGKYIYSVKCVAAYDGLYSDKESDIPAYEPFVSYDISVLAKDFLSLAKPPIVESNGALLNQGYTVENGRIVLFPYEKKGVYKVIYNKRPLVITSVNGAVNDNTEIELDEDLCALLPLLVASYIWVDDDPEKAQYYMNLYRERAADIERRLYNATPIQINTNGW